MCILLYVKLIWCSGIPYIYGQLKVGSIFPMYMCILLYVKLYCGVVVFHRSSGQLEEGANCPQYMCIVLSVKLIWCSGIP